MSIADEIRSFIHAELLLDPKRTPLEDGTPILDEALVDSLGVFRLASFVEERFGVEIRDADMVPEHFGSVASIARLVERRRTKGDPGSAASGGRPGGVDSSP